MKPGLETTDEGEENGDAPDHREGDPRPLPYDFEKELIQRSNRHIRLYESFVPVSQVYPLTRKFYAQYEQRQPSDTLRYLRHTWPDKHLERQRQLAKAVPLLESQVYGWLPLKSGERAAELNFLHAKKLRCGMTVHGERLIAERITARPPFNGLRFLLH
ncbi:uncharacterized protein LOC6555654 [Drosophila erecta]|uniref:Uncharacterized protein n=1 Tax=Drosophila erecta TaxID=7220 RepID=B3P8T1_DROER|nr:uncharacterized protein LOC6555654 [Drosophila erecta]EDV45536.1 uncharacterized protein Dere_GG12668 [Drosophila erecta]